MEITDYAILRTKKIGHEYTGRGRRQTRKEWMSTRKKTHSNWEHLQRMLNELTRRQEMRKVNWDPERSHLNRWLVPIPGGTGCINLADLVKKMAGPDIRKNAALLVEQIATFSPEMNGRIDVEKWAQDTANWAKKKHGKNLLGIILHLDEKTPHIHILSIPLVLDKKTGKEKLNARALYGGVDGDVKLSEIYADYHQAVAHHGLRKGKRVAWVYDEETGEEVRVRHTTLKEYRERKEEASAVINRVKEIANMPHDQIQNRAASIGAALDAFQPIVATTAEAHNERARRIKAEEDKKRLEEEATRQKVAGDVRILELETQVKRLREFIESRTSGGGVQVESGLRIPEREELAPLVEEEVQQAPEIKWEDHPGALDDEDAQLEATVRALARPVGLKESGIQEALRIVREHRIPQETFRQLKRIRECDWLLNLARFGDDKMSIEEIVGKYKTPTLQGP
jgi:hypothetical protein